ncbi:MAG TPA: tetratricopeptide repeat protein [Pyrinomonadaceae bacterium]|nr:tetratricopeptide repeat protein [Pyrinomonadaceae bacterium]
MKSAFIRVPVLLLLAVVVAAQQKPANTAQIQKHYEAAQKLEQQGKWQEAEQEWRAALALAPTDARAWTNLGVTLNRQDKTAEALEAWRKAISLDPKLPGPHFNVGLTLVRKGDYKNAVAPLRQTLDLDPNNHGAKRALAVALIGAGRNSEATPVLGQLVSGFPEDPALLELAAQHYLRERRYADAETVLLRRLSLPRTTSFLWAQYGDALDGTGRTPEAADAYRKAVDLDPESTLTRYGLGYLYWKLYRYDDAERELLEVLRRAPKDPRASFTLGDLYLTKGDAQRALPFLEVARAAYPKEFDTRFALGRALVLTGDLERGIEELRAAVSIDQSIADGHFQLGRALIKAGKSDEGKQELQKAQALHDKQRKKESDQYRKKLPDPR